MRHVILAIAMLGCLQSQAQPGLKVGDLFPDLIFRNVLNAPARQIELRKYTARFTILNFWGTWCSPCIPEMDSLARLQAANPSKLQVIAISNDPMDRLQRYLQKKPSKLWLVSDTSSYLYQQFSFNYVGQSAILDQQHRIIALVRTDSINQGLLDKLYRREAIASSAETGNKTYDEEDLFAADSTLGAQVTWSSYRPGVTSMSRFYTNAFAGRRYTFINLCLINMLMEAYQVHYKQIVYEIPEKEVCESNNKNTLYCFDLLVRPDQKDSLRLIMQEVLRKLMPVKTRLEKRPMEVYVLRRLPDAMPWQPSTAEKPVFGFSGRGFEGKAIAMKPFVDYVANELATPVVDETGLSGRYDITTELVMRNHEEFLLSLKKIGFTVEKTTRSMDVVVIYR